MRSPTARFEGPVSGEPFLVGVVEPAGAGYVREEWLVTGTATSYALRGERSTDGRWEAEPAGRAPFRTRIVVLRPADPARFDGTTLVEWMNVSGGIDAAPDWFFLRRHLMRQGSAWVGVSAQKAGIDGGGLVPGMPLKQANAARYGSLEHPGDAFAFDIYSEVGRALRTPGSGPLGPLATRHLIAIGESQSAGFLVTYVNAVDPIERCFDAFLIHGRPGTAAALDGSYLRAAADGDVSKVGALISEGHRIREDVRVPVLTFQSETDVVTLGGGRARQPDGPRFRLWELAGAAHFDTYGLMASHVDREGIGVEELAARLAPTAQLLGMTAGTAVNSGPQQHYVLNAALAHLVRWVRDGTPPPEAARLESLDAAASRLARDPLGIARGGIRTPWVDAPTAALSGDPPGGDGFLFLFGRTIPFDAETLARLYPGGAEEHVKRFEGSLAAALRAGFLLDVDAAEICALARHGRQPSGWNP
ncbi:MAG TPA: alpha/beta hydrolase domain-containing protein [Myxococcota bacterium]|nr:alpha/beta hydrolase domain-containing protein [Myxococcota bacterium]